MPIYRNFRNRNTGRWVDVQFTFEKDDPQNTPELAHRTSIAAALGLTAGDLETVDSAADSRVGVLIRQAVSPAQPLTEDQQAWASATPPQKLEMLARRLGFVA